MWVRVPPALPNGSVGQGEKVGSENKKIITASFVVAGVLAWLVTGILLDLASTSVGMIARWQDNTAFRHGVPITVGVIVWLALQLNSKVDRWADEIVSEIRKVVWPSRKDTTMSTFVVCMFTVFAAVVIGLYDLVAHFVIDFVIKL